MTQYKSRVEQQRKILAAEEWGRKINYLLAQNGYLEKSYNNGLVVREFKDGTQKVISNAVGIDELVNRMSTYEADTFGNLQ